MAAPSHTPLEPIRLVTTAHQQNGTAYISSDDAVKAFHPFGPARTGFYTFHNTNAVPVNQSPGVAPTGAPQTQSIPRPAPGGSTFCVTDFPPGAAAPMHRTQSMDYIVVLHGSCVMSLDNGQSTVLNVGDCVVQQGTMHKWENKGNVVCRLLVVMVGAEKIKTADGQEFGGTL